MEDNLADALKMAFAVLTFVMALSVCIITFSQARVTSEAVLYMRDDTNYYEYIENQETTRQVGIETIIPTLYRYYKENYKVQFFEKYYGKGNPSNVPLNIYQSTKTSTWINSFDVNEEVLRREPWTGNTDKDYKHNLNALLTAGIFVNPSGNNQKISYANNSLFRNKDNKFYEILGEYQYKKSDDGSISTIKNTSVEDDGDTIELVKQEVKRVITYTLKK